MTMSLSFLFGLLSTALAQSPYVDLLSWDGSTSNHPLDLVNDPVMGGQSSSNFTIDTSTSTLFWTGEVRTVPSLDAPGFCMIQTTGFQRFNDASPYTHLGLRLLSTIAYTGWRVCFAADEAAPEFKCFKANFGVPQLNSWQEIYIPWNSFSDDWSSYTGEPITTCAEDASVCPTVKNLQDIYQISLWAEGVNGEFAVNVEWVRAANITSSSAPQSKQFKTLRKGEGF